MNILLNSGWMRTLIAKAIKFGINKKAGIKANLGINDLEVADSDEGVKIHLNVDITMSKEELERLIKNLI